MIFNSEIKLNIDNKSESETISLAAAELEKYLQQRFNLNSDGTVLLNAKFNIKDIAGYAVTLKENELVFEAESEVELLYSVYTFAEEILGFSFFMPGEDRILEKSDLEIKNGEIISVKKPPIKNRGFIQEFPFSEDSFKLADWMAKNRMNYLLTWMKYYDEISEELKGAFAVRGIMIESGHHSFDYWMPPQKYYNEHPEYYAIINGERIVPDADSNGYLQGGQLCVTNEGMRTQLVKNMIEYCNAHPEIKTITLIPNDGFGWCECEGCSKYYDKSKKGKLYSLSEHVYEAQELYHSFFNDIATRVNEVLPDITITLCAYVNYVEPAKNFKLKKGFGVHFAPYWRCINHHINDESCPINSEYKKTISKWVEAKDGGEINIYEYYMGVNLYISLPMIFQKNIFNEVKYYSENNIDGILTQFHLTHWIAYGMNYYMMAKAMYGETPEAVTKAYERIFGNDAKLAETFYSQLEEITKSAGPCHVTYPRSLLNRTDIKDYESALKTAKELSGKNPDDKICKGIEVWAEYLLKFKQLFDRHIAGENVYDDIDEFYKWVEARKDSKVFVTSKIKMLFEKWQERISQGKAWYHYNLDWEDDYVSRHDTLLNSK